MEYAFSSSALGKSLAAASVISDSRNLLSREPWGYGEAIDIDLWRSVIKGELVRAGEKLQ